MLELAVGHNGVGRFVRARPRRVAPRRQRGAGARGRGGADRGAPRAAARWARSSSGRRSARSGSPMVSSPPRPAGCFRSPLLGLVDGRCSSHGAARPLGSRAPGAGPVGGLGAHLRCRLQLRRRHLPLLLPLHDGAAARRAGRHRRGDALALLPAGRRARVALLPLALLLTAAWQVYVGCERARLAGSTAGRSAGPASRCPRRSSSASGACGSTSALVGGTLVAALALAARRSPRARACRARARCRGLAVGLVALLVTPAAWALSSVLVAGLR